MLARWGITPAGPSKALPDQRQSQRRPGMGNWSGMAAAEGSDEYCYDPRNRCRRLSCRGTSPAPPTSALSNRVDILEYQSAPYRAVEVTGLPQVELYAVSCRTRTAARLIDAGRTAIFAWAWCARYRNGRRSPAHQAG
jgi:hypothetical protein